MATFVPASSGRYYDVDITGLVALWRGGTANNGLITRLGGGNTMATFTSKEWATASQRPQLVVGDRSAAQLHHAHCRIPLVSDPYNGTTNPEGDSGRGADLFGQHQQRQHRLSRFQQRGRRPVGARRKASLYVGDLGAPGSGPVAFTQGSPSSGLTYAFTSLASTTDNLAFSNNGGASFAYTPTPDANGYDSAVTHIRVTPQGIFAGASGSGSPNFTAQLPNQGQLGRA